VATPCNVARIVATTTVNYRILHVSDLHAGPPFNASIAVQVAQQAHQLRPDLTVISGDLVQRADFPSQWHIITSYLASLPQPQLVVPGNHDVPLFNGFERLFSPLRAYAHYISPDMNPVFERPGLVVAGACSAHGLTLAGGRLSKLQLAALERIFARFGADTCKIAVFHHQVIKPPRSKHSSRLSNADDTVRLLDRWGVDMLLCGHLHFPHVESTLGLLPGLQRGTIVCQSGTTTSRRGRATERGRNSFQLIEVERSAICITSYHYHPNEGHFVPAGEHSFPRSG
jgi:3',5'-cyclic AMP phosphodiesterase CpdA